MERFGRKSSTERISQSQGRRRLAETLRNNPHLVEEGGNIIPRRAADARRSTGQFFNTVDGRTRFDGFFNKAA